MINNQAYYFAYGMNTNLREMSSRCPKSTLIGKAAIADQKLVFRSVADYEYSYGDTLYGALWEITDKCEESLDKLEGYPNVYDKEFKICALIQSFNKNFKPGIFKTMLYKMNSNNIAYPSDYYLDCLVLGYRANKLPKQQLVNAIRDTL